jgi:hypothetical protein
VPLSLTTAVQETLTELMRQGKGDLDHSAIVIHTEQGAGIEIRRPQSEGAHH